MRISYKRQPYKRIQQKYRTNNFIRVPQVRLIDENGENIGVVETAKALAMAQEGGFDLVEVSPLANPPVAKILNYNKLKYQEEKEKRKEKAKQKKIEVKGIRLSLRISEHDIEIRINQAEKFLGKGNKVRIEMILRGREKALLNVAFGKLNEFIKMIPGEIKIEQEIKKQPRGLAAVIGR